MTGFKREVTPLTIDLLKRDNRLAHESTKLSLAERVRRSLEKGDELLRQARLASKREG